MSRLAAGLVITISLMGCVPREPIGAAAGGVDARLTTQVLASVRSTLGAGDEVKLAYPRVDGIHAGDVFLAPKVDGDYVSFNLAGKLCNLGRELGPDVPVDNRFGAQSTPLDSVFTFSASLQADIVKLFAINVNAPGKPVTDVRIKIGNAEAWALKPEVKPLMYPDDSACAKAVQRELARKRGVVMIDLVYKGSPYMRVAHNVSAGAKLRAELGWLSGLGGTLETTDITTFGSETTKETVLLGASYRHILSAADLRP